MWQITQTVYPINSEHSLRLGVFWWAYVPVDFTNILRYCRADSSFAPSQWETALLCHSFRHCLGSQYNTGQQTVLLCWLNTYREKHQLINHCDKNGNSFMIHM